MRLKSVEVWVIPVLLCSTVRCCDVTSRDCRWGSSHLRTVRSITRAAVPRSSTRIATGARGHWWTPGTAIPTRSATAARVLAGRRRRHVASRTSHRRRLWPRRGWRRYRSPTQRRSRTRCTAHPLISSSTDCLVSDHERFARNKQA